MDEDLRAHPRFREAAVALSRAALDLYSGNRLLSIVANDRGRFMMSLLLIALAQDAAGLTAGRLASACAANGLCSGGRARAIFRLMQWAGYVERRGDVFRPTEKLLASQDRRVRRTVAAFAVLRPDIADTLDAPGFVEPTASPRRRRFWPAVALRRTLSNSSPSSIAMPACLCC
jgi:hypothetical protein